MSCILTGITSLFVHPDRITVNQLIWSCIRDALLIVWHGTLIALAYNSPPDQFKYIEDSLILPWLFLNVLISILRIIRTPLQFKANSIISSQYNTWESQQLNHSWSRYFQRNSTFCQMRLYSYLDWGTYFVWVFGAWTIRYVETQEKGLVGFILIACQYEIAASTITYVTFIISYVFMFLLHRASKGRLFPGLILSNNDWPDMCPTISFDRRAWLQPGETRDDYRTRVVEEFYARDFVMHQPRAFGNMSLEPESLSCTELDTLRTFEFQDKIETDTALIPTEAKNSIDDHNNEINHPIIISIPPIVPTEYLDMNIKTTDETCALCIDDYQKGDVLRELYCGHRFHSECVDEWLLQTKRTCPICNGDALGKSDH